MRRTAARIGVVAALALSMGVATVVAPPAHAEDATGLISPVRANDDEMNYAINLAPGASAADMERAIALVPGAKGAALASYPQIGTFFAQSATPSFAPDLAAKLKDAGIPVHSIGPTRTQGVLYYERVTLPTDEAGDAPAEAPADAAGTGLAAMRDETATEAATEEIFNWGAQTMHAREAGQVDVERAPVTVAVVDSGVEDIHPDLAGRVDTERSVKCSVNGVATQDFYGWRDEFYHGTHVAGIIAANHNDIGIDGIAPESTIVAIQATNDNRLIYPEYVTCAFMWAADHGVDIVNNSYSMDPWVYWSPTDPEQAAGLEAATQLFYLSGYAVADGTSMATPHVSGVAALIKSVHPELTGDQVIELMKKQAAGNYGELNAPWDGKEYRGVGLPDALDAVLKDQPRPVVGQIEYSTDGAQWAPLDGQEISGSVSVRATVSGAVTSARLLVGGQELATGTPAEGVVMLQADAVDVSSLTGAHVVTVEASGRNSDPRADDDVTVSAPFSVAGASEDPNEAVAGEWKSDALGWWWRKADGSYPSSQALRIDGKTYRFDERGYMVTGWVLDGGWWFYHEASGAQASGWANVDGTWYYLEPPAGAMVTGWVQDGGAWYYLTASGAMATGWVKDGAYWYYLDEGGVMVTGERTIDGIAYSFDSSGRMR